MSDGNLLSYTGMYIHIDDSVSKSIREQALKMREDYPEAKIVEIRVHYNERQTTMDIETFVRRVFADEQVNP